MLKHCIKRRVVAHHSSENEGDLKSVREAAAAPNRVRSSHRLQSIGALKCVPKRSSTTSHGRAVQNSSYSLCFVIARA